MKTYTVIFPERKEIRNNSGFLHNLNGPAVEYSDGSSEFWINGNRYYEESVFLEEVKKNKENETSFRITKTEYDLLLDLIYNLKKDLYQHVRVAEFNLTGIDLNFPEDKPIQIFDSDGKRKAEPRFITRDGIEESLSIIKKAEGILRGFLTKKR